MKLILHTGKKKSILSKVPSSPARLPARCFSEFTAGDVAGRMLGISGEEKGTDGFQWPSGQGHITCSHQRSHANTIWTLNACLQCLNVIALVSQILLKLFSEIISLFLLLLLGVFTGCIKSVASRSCRCPNRGTKGVVTLTFHNYKSVYSINKIKPHKRRVLEHTQTSASTCWRSKHKPTKLHHTFQFHTTTQTMQNLNFLRHHTHLLHRQETPCENVKLHVSG